MDPQTLFNNYRDAQQSENATVDAIHTAQAQIAAGQAALAEAEAANSTAASVTAAAKDALLTAALQGVVPETV